jgi:hypothetical protein
MERVWSLLLAFNSLLWFLSVVFLANGFGMLIVALDWKRFVLAITIFVAVCLSVLVITGLVNHYRNISLTADFAHLLRGRELHPRPRGYEPRELLLLHPASA